MMNLLIHVATLVFLAVLLSIRLQEVMETERDGSVPPGKCRYFPLEFHLQLMLPLLFLLMLILKALDGLTRQDLLFFLGLNMQILLTASLYFAVLLFVLPWLRKRICARTCGFLWTIPFFLYYAYYHWVSWERPLVVLRIPENWMARLALVWGTGTAAVLLWNIAIHLHFRREILSCAVPVTDAEILEAWQTEQGIAGIKRRYPLMRSSAVTTPLSIGVLPGTIRVVLPSCEYQSRELTMIFRHEIVHICRKDACNKLLLLVCTAAFWFNPLMWMARRRCSDDLELSCDETVLVSADHRERLQYANLLLTTAGDSRGFTTCLSASAKSLRYRLKCVMASGKKPLGGAVLGAAFMLMFLPFGLITVSWAHGSAGELVIPKDAELTYASYIRADAELPDVQRLGEQEPLKTLLRSLDVDDVAGKYSPDDFGEDSLHVFYTADGAEWHLELTDTHITRIENHDRQNKKTWFLRESPDWESILACLPEE